mgnify:CR=1 FL=1
MNKRANRVYWLLFIMVLILGVSIIIDGIRAKKHENDNSVVQVIETTAQTESTTESTTGETATSEDATEGTTLDEAAANQKLKDFYDGQVFVGDSIMDGFARYVPKTEAPEWLNNVIFLTKVSWGINTALDDDGPMYQGKAQNVCDSLGAIKPERIFINLGINEMRGLGTPGYSIEKLLNTYGEAIAAIKEATPSSKIYIINITPCTEEKETALFSNATIKEFNEDLKAQCDVWGVEYLDLASKFGDVLDPELSSDDFVHHNDKAYSEIWVPFFRNLALESE